MSAINESNKTISQNEQMQIRCDKLSQLRAAGKDPFEQVRFERTHSCEEICRDFANLEGKRVKIAGRIMSKRGMGKVSFCDLNDKFGHIQIFTKIDLLGEEAYKEWQKLDIGDWVGIDGEVMRTQRGEISIRNYGYVLLSKSIRPLPEKFHGLQDMDTRYRRRYLDLIVNPEVRQTFAKRSIIIRTLRNYLDNIDFLEVETPILNVIPGGAAARPFITHHNAMNIDLYLRIAPELYLKRLIVGGMDRVYEIGRQFRNEGMDTKHNPEFTLLELYQAFTDYKGMMELTETLIYECAMAACGKTTVTWRGVDVDLKPPFRRLTMRDAVLQYSGVDFDQIKDLPAAVAVATEHNLPVEPGMGRGDIFNLFFETYVEDKLVQPTFIYDYPIEISPLTKKKPGRPELTERFELFICGAEFANAYSELNDPIDQRERFKAQLRKRDLGDEEANRMDEDYCMALEYGLPPTGGMGMGIDRLTMLLTDSESIRDVLLFPTMKPLSDGVGKVLGNAENAAVTSSGDAEITEAAVTPNQAVHEVIDFSRVEIEPLFTETVDFDTFSRSDFRAVKVKACVAVPKSKKLLQFTLDDGTGTDRIILSGIHAYYEPEELVGKTLVAITNLPPRKMMGIESCGMLLSAVNKLKESEEEELHLLIVDDHIPAGAKLY